MLLLYQASTELPRCPAPSSPLIYIGACVWLSSEQARVRCHCVLNSVRQFWHRCKIMLHNILCFLCWKCLLALSHWNKDTWNLDAYLAFWLTYWWLSLRTNVPVSCMSRRFRLSTIYCENDPRRCPNCQSQTLVLDIPVVYNVTQPGSPSPSWLGPDDFHFT